MPAFKASDGATLAKVTADDKTLVIGDYDRVFLVSASDGVSTCLPKLACGSLG